MIEFDSLTDFEKLAPTEFKELKEALDRLELKVEGFKGAGVIEEKFFKVLIEPLLNQVTEKSFFIIRESINQGKSENDVRDFINSLRKKIAETISSLADDSFRRDSDGSIFSISGLNFDGFIKARLELSLQIALKQKAGETIFNDLQDLQEQMNNHLVTDIVPGMKVVISDYPTRIPDLNNKNTNVESHPELVRTEPLLHKESILEETPEDERFGLELLFNDLNINVDLTWLDDPNKTPGKPLETLTWLLEQTESSLGKTPTDISMYNTNFEELRLALQEVFEQTSAPLFKRNNPDLDVYLNQYNLSKTRLIEIVKVIDRLIEGDQRLNELWKENTFDYLLYGTKEDGESIDQFLSRIDPANGITLTNEDEQDLIKLQNYLISAKKNYDLLSLPAVGQTKKNYESLSKLLNDKIDEVTALMEQSGLIDKAKQHAKEHFEKNEAVAIAMYEEIRTEYTNLPPFESLKPESLQDFNREFVSAVAILVRKELNISTSGGGTVINLPSESVVLFDKIKFKVQSNLPPGDNNFEFFFENFPWRVMIPGFTKADAKKVFGNVWEMRLLHISLIHNSTSKIRAILNEAASPEFPEKIRSLVSSLAKDGGGYKENALYYMKQFEPGSPEEKMFGKEDEAWVVPNLELFFMQMCEMYCPGLILDSQSGKDKLGKWKEKFIEMIPDEIKPADEEVISMAWDMAIWKLYLSLRMFEFDKDSIDSKMGQRLKSRWYGPKVLPGASNTGTVWNYTYVDSLEKTMIPIADFVHYNVHLEPGKNVYHTTIEEVVEYYKLLSSIDSPDLILQKYLDRLKEFIVDVKQRSLGKGANVDKYYQIMWVAPHATNMKMGIKYMHLRMPIAVPKSYIEASKRSGIYGSNGNWYVALRDRQIVNSMIKPEYVRWDTGTPDWKSQWAKVTGDHNAMFETIKLEKKDNSLPLIETTPHPPVKKVNMFNLKADFARLSARVDKFVNPSVYARNSHAFIKRNVLPKVVHAEDLVSHWNVQLVTQTIGRYGQQNLKEAGPSDPGVSSNFSPLRTGELLLDMPRTPWEGGALEKDGDVYKDLADAWHHEKDKTKIRGITTRVPKQMRDAVDLMVLGNSKEQKKAETTIIQEFLLIVVGGYLDKYRYKAKVEFQRGADIKDLYEELHCACPDAKPMSTPYIEKTINNLIVLIDEFLTSAVYGGNKPESRLDEAIVRTTIENMMIDRGILYSPMHGIANAYFIEHELPKLSTGTAKEDEKKGH